MNKLLIIVLLPLLCSCAGRGMTASSTCTFSPAEKNGRYYTFITPGDAKCTFTLAAPIDKAQDAETYARAFKTMLGESPSIAVEEK